MRLRWRGPRSCGQYLGWSARFSADLAVRFSVAPGEAVISLWRVLTMARFSTVRRERPGFGADRVAALTGAASGIGRALALELGRSGVRLALADLDAPGLSSVVTTIRDGGGVAEGR